MTGPSSLLLRGGRIIDPASGFDSVADVLIKDGCIAAIGRDLDGSRAARVTLDVSGLVVVPGLVDLHTHVRFPGFPDKETMASCTRAAAAGGYTTLCAMANTDPVVDSVDVFRQVQREVVEHAVVNVRQLGAVTLGLQGERLTDMAALAEMGAIAFSDDGKPIGNRSVMSEALGYSAVLQRPISVHEEDRELVRDGVANAGEVARGLGLAEWPCDGEASLVARDLNLLVECGGRLHIAHVSCRESVAILAAARARGLPVTSEVTPHHLRLTDRLLWGDAERSLGAAHPCVKVNPPLRSADDVEACVTGLAEGTIDVVATDHAPHAAKDKVAPFATAAFGFSALETALPLVLDLVRAGRLSMMQAIARMTVRPAVVFGLSAGRLAPGVPADVCVFDPDLSWRVVAGDLHSRGKNTPLDGVHLRGRVIHTVVGGRLVHGNLP